MVYLDLSCFAILFSFTVFDSNASISFLIVGVTPLCSHFCKTSVYCSSDESNFFPMAASVGGGRSRYSPINLHFV